jgi:2-polyprenyl-3-methyl-5-hydroxy-6-metoxy-1,4-benzoquinol methylase
MNQNKEFQPTNTPFDFSKYDSTYEQKRIKILEGLIPPGHGKRAIDIGSGPGFFVKMLKDGDWKVSAIDTDQQNIEKASEYAFEVHQGDAISVLSGLAEGQFDLALALELIEHMPRDMGENMLKSIFRILKPGGRLLISTPNRHSPEGLAGAFWKEKIRGKKWDAWDVTHVHIYSSGEILKLLKQIGFSVDSVTGYHYEVLFPKIGSRKLLPVTKSSSFPFNLLGFNIIIGCYKP